MLKKGIQLESGSYIQDHQSNTLRFKVATGIKMLFGFQKDKEYTQIQCVHSCSELQYNWIHMEVS